MHAPHGDDRPGAASVDADAPLSMRLAIADAVFVAEGIKLGLPLEWGADRAPRPVAEHRPTGVVLRVVEQAAGSRPLAGRPAGAAPGRPRPALRVVAGRAV